jgi:hypothetical protein
VTVLFEPSRFALTSTPSMAPSAAEVTRPASAAACWGMAGRTENNNTLDSAASVDARTNGRNRMESP